MILRHLLYEKKFYVGFLLIRVVVDNMVKGFHFAFELVGDFVYLLGFVIESFNCMTLGYVLFVVFVRFMYMVQKSLLIEKFWLINVPIINLLICVESLLILMTVFFIF